MQLRATKTTASKHPDLAHALIAKILFLSMMLVQPSFADQAIVKDLKPLPVMQEIKGRALYQDNCAKCHGGLADGVDGKGPPLVHPIYRAGHHPDSTFYRAAAFGVRAHHWAFGDMPPQTHVQQDQMQAIIRYLRKLQHKNGVN